MMFFELQQRTSSKRMSHDVLLYFINWKGLEMMATTETLLKSLNTIRERPTFNVITSSLTEVEQ